MSHSMGKPGDVFDIRSDDGKSVNARVRVVNCFHGVPCVAYVMSTLSHRLKEEYRGLKGADIVALRKSGTAISEEVRGKKGVTDVVR